MTDALGDTFTALAHPIRRAILARLAQGEAPVTELAAPFGVSLPAISRHLRVLEEARLLRRERVGRVHRCRLDAGPLREAASWIDTYRHFWEGQLDALSAYLGEAPQREEKTCSQSSQVPAAPSGSGARSPRRRPRSTGRGPTRRR